MPEELHVGATGNLEWVVEDRHCTQRGAYAIFSTPNMVMLLEETAMEALRPFLGPDQSSVGIRVDVRHLASTPRGMRVRATATVRAIDRRRVTFDVVIDDEVERIGEATHERFIIDLDTFMARLAQKMGPAI